MSQNQKKIPYGRQTIDETDVDAVVSALKSDWLTTGPCVEQFETDFASFVSAREAIAVNSGTAALHASLFSLDIGPGCEVLIPSITFAATANAVVYLGAKPVFVDVDPETLLIDVAHAESLINPLTRAIIAVDFAGQPCDYSDLRNLCDNHRLDLLVDACHSIGASYKGRSVGSLGDLTAFSFHPVKSMTTGEGGMVTTNNPQLAKRVRQFRNHGIQQDFRQREKQVAWEYDIEELGFNYRLTDFQSALGRSQLKRLPDWIVRRQEIAERYDTAFSQSECIEPLTDRNDRTNAHHLYVVRLKGGGKSDLRRQVFEQLRAKGIGVNVHYRPVYFHTFYQKNFGHKRGLCPNAEAAYEQILSLPIFPELTDTQVDYVVSQLFDATKQRHSKAA